MPEVPKMTVTNLNTGLTMRAQYNPEQLEETVSANWARQGVPGLSHNVLQFSNTANETFAFELFFRANTEAEMQEIHRWRRFLKSLVVPRGGANTIAGGAPPRVLLVWPRMLSLTCILPTAKFTHEHFNKMMQSRIFRVAVQFEEIRDVRMTSEDVFDDRELRFGNVPGGDIPAGSRAAGSAGDIRDI
jgi:hypothetical protein